jgi:hypothetical protein
MKTTMKKAAIAVLAALALVSFQAQAGGNVRLVNETDALIHPWFKSNCWGFAVGPQPSWVFFGGVAARSQFEWGFSDPGLTDPACPHPKIEFTYTTDLTPPPDRVKGDVKAKFKFSADKNVVIQVGGKLKAFRLGDDNENDRDDD